MKIQFLDAEMLCWADGNTSQGQTNHIIQIGLVEVNSEDLKISRSKSYFIRPQDKHFDVSDYCTELTGITRSTLVNYGHYFPEVMKTIKKDFAPQTKVTYAWGSDFEPLSTHCIKYDCFNPWSTNGIWDFGIIFRNAYDFKHKMSLSEALQFLKLDFQGIAHNAENDAKSLAILHNEMMSIVRKNVVDINFKQAYSK